MSGDDEPYRLFFYLCNNSGVDTILNAMRTEGGAADEKMDNG